jgi:fatty-acyl-CoA synthase
VERITTGGRAGADAPLENLADAFELVARTLADQAAVLGPEGALTWQTLDTMAGRFAEHLRSRGVGAGDRVAIALRNRPEYLVTLLGSLKAGAVPVNVNHRYRQVELAHVIEDSGARMVVHEPELSAAVTAVMEQRTPPGSHVCVQDARWHEVVTTGPVCGHRRRTDADWLLYTGGTTGRPKAVLTRHSNVMRAITSVGRRAYGDDAFGERGPSDSDDLVRQLRSRADRVVMLPLPPFMHATGLYNALGALLAGGVVVMLEPGSFRAADAARAVSVHGVTDLVVVGDVMAVPFADAVDESLAGGQPYDLSSLRRVISSGVRWGVPTKNRLLAQADCTLYDIVAATEGGPYAVDVSSRSAGPGRSSLRLAPGARVVDELGQDVRPGSGVAGLLAAPVPAGVRYAGEAPSLNGSFRELGGVLYSVPGDVAVIEEDGSLRLLGRDSAVVNSGGEKVFAEEVELVLRDHPGIADAVVVGVPDAVWGEVVTAVAVPAGDPLDVAALKAFVGQRLAGYKAPRAVHWVPELRRTGAGKVDLEWARSVASAPGRSPITAS